MEYAIDGLNSALRTVQEEWGDSDRLVMTSGPRDACRDHTSPMPSRGADAPEMALTRVQYRDDPFSHSFPPSIPEKIAGEGET